jgi:hypothetical protein
VTGWNSDLQPASCRINYVSGGPLDAGHGRGATRQDDIAWISDDGTGWNKSGPILREETGGGENYDPKPTERFHGKHFPPN